MLRKRADTFGMESHSVRRGSLTYLKSSEALRVGGVGGGDGLGENMPPLTPSARSGAGQGAPQWGREVRRDERGFMGRGSSRVPPGLGSSNFRAVKAWDYQHAHAATAHQASIHAKIAADLTGTNRIGGLLA